MDKLIKESIYNSFISGFSFTSISIIITLIIVPIIISNIGLEYYGFISITLIFSGFSGVFDLGFSKLIVIYLSQGNDKNVGYIYLINYVFFTLIVLFSIQQLFSNEINLFGEKISSEVEFIKILTFSSLITLAFSVLNNLYRSALEFSLDFHKINFGNFMQSTIIYMFWFILSVSEYQFFYYYLVPPISAFLCFIYFFVSSNVSVKITLPNFYDLIKVFKDSIGFFKVGFLNSIHLTLFKYLLIYIGGNGKAIGIFELSIKLTNIMKNIFGHFTKPFFSISSNKKFKKQKVLSAIYSTIKYCSLIFIIGLLIFFIFYKPIILYFFSEYSKEILWILISLLLSTFFVSISEGIQRYELAKLNYDLVFNIKFIAIILSLLIIFISNSIYDFNLLFFTLSYSFGILLIGLFWLTFLKFNKLS